MTQRTETSEWGREVQEIELARLSNGLSETMRKKSRLVQLGGWMLIKQLPKDKQLMSVRDLDLIQNVGFQHYDPL